MAASPRLARGTAVIVTPLSRPSVSRTLHGGIVALVWTLLGNTSLAQPEYQLSRVLFEPHPVPADEVAAYRNPARDTATITTASNPATFPTSAPYTRFSFINTPPPANPASAATAAADRANAEAAIAAYSNIIVETEGDTGPFSADLFEQLLSLSQAYQQLDQHDEALATLEKAEFISRINNGLYTPRQFAVVEQMVDSLIANGNMQEAMRKQQYLFYLHTQYYGPYSRQLVPALEQLGDWSMEAFAAGVHGSTSVGFLTSGSTGGMSGIDTLNGLSGFGAMGDMDVSRISGTGTGNAGFTMTRRQPALSPRAQAIFNLELAQRRYHQAIANLLDSNDVHNAEILGLEEKLLQSIYYGAHRRGLMQDPNFYLDARIDITGSRISHAEFESNMLAFINGRNALSRTLIYLETNPATDPMARLVTLLNLGDWHALFNRILEASTYYQRANEFAATMPARQQEWQALLTPEVPRQLPDFIALPHSRASFGIADNAVVRFDGYMDVSLNLSRSGNVRNLKILKMTDNVTPALSKRLRRLLRSAPFRPALVAGEPVAANNTLVRYYFADLGEETRI